MIYACVATVQRKNNSDHSKSTKVVALERGERRVRLSDLLKYRDGA